MVELAGASACASRAPAPCTCMSRRSKTPRPSDASATYTMTAALRNWCIGNRFSTTPRRAARNQFVSWCCSLSDIPHKAALVSSHLQHTGSSYQECARTRATSRLSVRTGEGAGAASHAPRVAERQPVEQSISHPPGILVAATRGYLHLACGPCTEKQSPFHTDTQVASLKNQRARGPLLFSVT